MSVDPYILLPPCIVEALADSDVEDILADPNDAVYAVRRRERVAIGRMDNRARQRFLNAAAANREFNRKNPFLKIALPRGERLEAWHDSISPDGCSFVVRRHGAMMSLDDLVSSGVMTETQAVFLADIAESGKESIVVAGKTGVGKTTILRAILSLVGATKRWVAIEGETEVQMPECGARIQIGNEIPFEAAIASALRYRPDTIVISEIKTSVEAVAYVEAMLSGHVGMTTIHSGSGKLVRARLKGKLPVDMADDDLLDMATAVVVYLDNHKGTRRVTELLHYKEAVM